MKELFDKDAILYILVACLLGVFGLSKVIPQVNQLVTTHNKIKSIKPKISDYENIQKQNANQANVKVKLDIPTKVYKPQYKNLTTENASIELVDGIVDLLKSTNNNVWQISYEELDPSEPLAKQKPKDCDILKLNLKLVGSYISFKNLLDRLYSWEYLTGINNIKIMPSQNDKRNLNIDLQLILYIKR